METDISETKIDIQQLQYLELPPSKPVKLLPGVSNGTSNFYRHVALQSFLAVVAVGILALVLGKDKFVAMSSIGATTFIVFAKPTSRTAKTINILGGYLICLAVGCVFALLPIHYAAGYPLVVGLCIFVMAILNVQHPPAVGAALAVVISEISLGGIVAMMLSTLVLSQLRYYLRYHLKDLF